jgi:hypothetical protein
MATQEELTTQATAEIEASKPMYAQVNNERREFTAAEYDQAIIDLANSKWDTQQFGYIQARQEAYGSWQQQMDMQFWDTQGNTTVWIDHIAKVKSDNPKPS